MRWENGDKSKTPANWQGFCVFLFFVLSHPVQYFSGFRSDCASRGETLVFLKLFDCAFSQGAVIAGSSGILIVAQIFEYALQVSNFRRIVASGEVFAKSKAMLIITWLCGCSFRQAILSWTIGLRDDLGVVL